MVRACGSDCECAGHSNALETDGCFLLAGGAFVGYFATSECLLAESATGFVGRRLLN